MKISEFSRKYGIPYHTVRNATYRLNGRMPHEYGKQYDENQLGIAVCQELRDNIANAEEHLAQLSNEYNKVKVIDWR